MLSVAESPDIARIRALPRRPATMELAPELIEETSARFRQPGSTAKLRPIQARALREFEEVQGGFFPIVAGGGKTLLTALAPNLIRGGSKRPVLWVPANLVGKTRFEFHEYTKDWKVHPNIDSRSYEAMGRVDAANFLEEHNPDCWLFDEAHKVKNPKAAVTKRFIWARERAKKAGRPAPTMVCSGTLVKDGIEDFHHLAEWALGEGSPVPHDAQHAAEWSQALGLDVRPQAPKMLAGALGKMLCGDPRADVPTLQAAFQRRLYETRGVVASGANDAPPVELVIRTMPIQVDALCQSMVDHLRETWQTPDGWDVSEAVDVWRHSRELVLGFHYVWDPRPPAEWLLCRQTWAAFVRKVLSYSHRYASEEQVKIAVETGELDDVVGLAALHEWQEAAPTFQINRRPIWHSYSVIRFAHEWGKMGPGIIWVEHGAFGRELARVSGWSYFGKDGLDDRGRLIDSVKGTETVIASIKSCGTGRNLQQWYRNLLVSPPSSPITWEQKLARTHRQGQLKPQVFFDILNLSDVHERAIDFSVAAARAIHATTGAEQRLLGATWHF